jgi:hypothetical protein
MPYYQTSFINDRFEDLLWHLKEDIKSKQN